jgi:hypothetical protein
MSLRLPNAVPVLKLRKFAGIGGVVSCSWVLIGLEFEARTSAKGGLLDVFAAGEDGEGLGRLVVGRAWVFIGLVHDAGVATGKRVGEHLANGVLLVSDVAGGVGIEVCSLEE